MTHRADRRRNVANAPRMVTVRKHRFVRPQSGISHASRFPLCHFTGCHACCIPPSACHYAGGNQMVN